MRLFPSLSPYQAVFTDTFLFTVRYDDIVQTHGRHNRVVVKRTTEGKHATRLTLFLSRVAASDQCKLPAISNNWAVPTIFIITLRWFLF